MDRMHVVENLKASQTARRGETEKGKTNGNNETRIHVVGRPRLSAKAVSSITEENDTTYRSDESTTQDLVD